MSILCLLNLFCIVNKKYIDISMLYATPKDLIGTYFVPLIPIHEEIYMFMFLHTKVRLLVFRSHVGFASRESPFMD